MDNVSAIVVAAGSGSRMGRAVPKQFLKLGGIPILVHTLRTLGRVSEIREIILAVPAGEKDRCRDMIRRYRLRRVAQVIEGGLRRQDSVRAGLRWVSSDPDLVLIHDGVRPLVTPSQIRDTIRAAARWGAATLAVPVQDTVKSARDGHIRGTLSREELYLAQTPQVFKRDWIIEAHRRFRRAATDDAALVERLGRTVRVVAGSPRNLKITTPHDLRLAEWYLRVGK
jgi:2-C-methyl-D-erythritol 4-phosphate cytidylyltransferase